MSRRARRGRGYAGYRARSTRYRLHLEPLEGRILLSSNLEGEGERPVAFPPRW